MNKRQKKKHAVDIEALKFAQCMEDWKWLDKRERRMFLKVCHRAIVDKFPLDEFFIFEIPLSRKDFWVFSFFELEYKSKKNFTPGDFRQIDFWIYKSKKRKSKFIVSPVALDTEKGNCFEAVYID